ncbi:DNA replication inhibitor plutonium [Contarinia nasturtii]|uniref:DNA replication inhibitor plutonium n=1 Tax=Contarinia nasturtii TaxID=265458 RepID=UPI0012D3C70E|nr:DNA replication inhibitor plutonium [Contarinia nasturtii]
MDDIDSICYYVFDSISRNDLTALQKSLKLYPDALEYMDRFSNTPLLYASYCGRSCLVRYLFVLGANHHRINIFGQNVLSLATYSGDIETCNVILTYVGFDEFNATGILSPLCVASLQGNIDIAKIYLTLEIQDENQFDCPSASLHGICPMQLAQYRGDSNMMNLLRPKHQLHLFKTQNIH